MKKASEAKILKFKDPAVDCERAIELFPWFLNGTLDAAETLEVRRHLEVCESCRHELAATADVWRLATDHPDSMDLALYGEDPDSLDAETRSEVASHLESCPECSDLAHAGRDANVLTFRRKRVVRSAQRRSSRWMSLVASVAAVLMLGSYLWGFSPQHLGGDVSGVSATQSSDSNPVVAADSLRRGDFETALLAREGWESGPSQSMRETEPVSSAVNSQVISALDFESASLGPQAASEP